MSAPAVSPPRKVNLRRPDVMEAVQAQVLSHYRSELIDRIKTKGQIVSTDGLLTVKLAKEFGFCYGVERAIDLAYAARKVFPNQPIYILGEIIHNPEVNDQLRGMDIKFLSGKEKDADIDDLGQGDVVLIPAFGTEVATRAKLEAKGCVFVDTTCGDVMSVWKRVRQYSMDHVTSIIHGKAWHEETKATSSQATATSGQYLVVFTLAETDYVCDYIVNGGNKQEFLEKFKGAYSPG
jgi:4-hydroxy-3-methylbut-2-enyl diphosphate reductase